MAADSAVSFVVDKLGNLLIAEASLLVGVRDEVEWLRDQLRWMKSFLKDAYTKRRRGDERAKHWERAVRDAAYHIEDIIESYMLEIINRRQQPIKCCGILTPIERYAHELKSRHKLGMEIKNLKAKIHQISENRIMYGLVDLGQSAPDSSTDVTLQERRRTSPHQGDSVIIGFQDHKHKILEELLNTKFTQRCVKSIVGMGGLGKTTLAKMVFNTDEITKYFGTRAWVSVSQDYTLVQLLKNLTKQVTGGDPDGLEESALKELLYRFLEGRRYFIVLDDVWTTEVWNLIEAVLPNNENGRVLLTTRFVEVARSVDPSIEPYQLPCLNEKESWELFVKRAFPSNHDTTPDCPRGLEGIARGLVKKCGGLPLAIRVLGGLMSTKKATPMAWMKVAEGIDWASTQDGQQCLKILALSYDDFPDPNIRSCFLYMGVFPEDSEIQASQLITLWVAEGFIPQVPNHTMEDTAVDYLDQLVQRSMIEVVRRDWDGSIKECRIHDLMRDLCLREAREDGFLDVWRNSMDLGNVGLDQNPIRLAIHFLDKVEGFCPCPDLRSLSIYGALEVTREMLQEWKRLRVMRLDSVKKSGFKSLLTETKTASHLRYLGLPYCYWLTELPPSIGNIFVNLQTLDIRETDIRQFPESLGKIKTLRHLYMSRFCKLPPNIGLLTNLQTIDAVDARGGWVEQSMSMLSNIQTLSIWELQESQHDAFANALRKLRRLSSLGIWESRSISTEFIMALSDHDHLFKLCLQGNMPLGQLPDSHGFPQNLTILDLEETKLEKDPMPTLERLPNLVSLVLGMASYFGNEMTCTTGGFLQLERLQLTMLFQLESWNVEDGAMPNLASLTLSSCDKLLMLPGGLVNLKRLQMIEFVGGLREFRSRLQEGVGEDWWKIKHVKSIKYKDFFPMKRGAQRREV